MSVIKWVLSLPWRVVRFPFRLYRRKISVQLIASHVLVVLLSIILLELAAIGIFIAVFQEFEDDAFTEYSMAEYAASAALVMSADASLAQLADGGERLDPSTRRQLDAALIALTTQESTEALDIEIGVNTDPPKTDLGLIESALIADSAGTIVASSNASWAATGSGIESIEFPMAASVSRRALDLAGAPSLAGALYVIDAENHVTVVAHPLIVDGELVGILTLQSERIEIPAFAEFAAGFAVANAFILAAIGLPALIVSIPVGIWRARRLSRRLSELADIATAMGDGDLTRRVNVRGQDEVARVSQRFNEMVDRLQTTDNARKSFVANVSHELRTPVAIIQGNLERMLADASANGDSPEERRTIDLLHHETLTLSRLIDDLFTMARLEETTLPLETMPLQFSEVVADVVEGIRGVAWEQRKVSLETLVPDTLPAVIADRTRLRQILGNLLYNALRHTPEGGLIVVRAEPAESMLRVSISDTGIGISADELARVFDRFYQVERSGRHNEGSGLGLTIVKQLVEAQGGQISVESQPDIGTTFHFTLPLAPD